MNASLRDAGAVGRGSVRRRGFTAASTKTLEPTNDWRPWLHIRGLILSLQVLEIAAFPLGSCVTAKPTAKPRLRRSFAPPRRGQSPLIAIERNSPDLDSSSSSW
jgi:hypothetical protein